MLKTLKFKPATSDFSKALKTNVSAYFLNNKITAYANAAMMVKSFIILSFWIGLYLLLILGNFPIAVNFLIWGLLGISIALVTINVGHDAIHGAYSSKKW